MRWYSGIAMAFHLDAYGKVHSWSERFQEGLASDMASPNQGLF